MGHTHRYKFGFEKKKNQVKSPSIWSRTPDLVRIRQSGRTGNRSVTWDVMSSCLLFCTYTDLKPVLSFTLSGKTYTWATNNIDRHKLIQMLSYVFYLFLVFFIFQFYDLLHSMYYYIYHFLSCTYIMSPFM